MSYCLRGDGAKITYQFANDPSTIYQTNSTPIDVVAGVVPPDGASNNYNPQGYQISFPSPQAGSGMFTQIITDYKTRPGTYGDFFDQHQGLFVSFIPCGATTFSSVEVVCSGAITIDPSVQCPISPDSQTNKQCKITISKDGNELFAAQGECPVNFTVACGEECPNGYCKIDCDTYPGYCCISEAEIQGFINQLK